MPLYEYQCEQCEGIFEVIQKFADAPLTQHENCGGKVHRLLSAPAFLFKGSGFYVNDYAKGSGAPTGGSNTKEESGKKEDSGAKADSGKKESAGKKEDAGTKGSASDSGTTAAASTKNTSESKPKSTSDTKSNS